MPFNYDALDTLVRELGGQREVVRELQRIGALHPELGTETLAFETVWRWIHKKVTPGAERIDALYYVAQEHGLQGLDFYTKPKG